jgi:hypothetical protein
VDALLDGYQSVLPLDAVERAAVAEVLPVAHLEYALSEVEYFADVTRSPDNADLAYRYLTGHTAWFESPDGSALLDHLRQRAAGQPAGRRSARYGGAPVTAERPLRRSARYGGAPVTAERPLRRRPACELISLSHDHFR